MSSPPSDPSVGASDGHDDSGADAPGRVDLSKPAGEPAVAGLDPPIWAIGPQALPNGSGGPASPEEAAVAASWAAAAQAGIAPGTVAGAGVTTTAEMEGLPLGAPPPDWVAVVDEEEYRATPRDRVIEVITAVVVAVALAGIGAGLAYVWAAISPRVVLEMTASGAAYTQPNPEGYVAGESVYLMMTVGLGIVSAVAVWLIASKRRGPVVLAGLAVGSVAGAALMAWLGQRIGLVEYQRLLTEAPVGSRFEVPVKVRSAILDVGHFKIQGAVLIQAMIAVAIYTLLAGFYPTASLRPERAFVRWIPPDQVQASDGRRSEQADPDGGPDAAADPEDPVNSGWPAPSDHRAAQAPPAAG